jgi:CheY-like chemotaxis protein
VEILEVEPGLAHVLLIEPNPTVRTELLNMLAAERYRVEACDSLEQALARIDDCGRVVTLVAWQSMDGLLTDERRHQLMALTRRLKLVLMVPRRWASLLEQSDLGLAVAGLIHKPVDMDELLRTLQRVLVSPLDSPSTPS